MPTGFLACLLILEMPREIFRWLCCSCNCLNVYVRCNARAYIFARQSILHPRHVAWHYRAWSRERINESEVWKKRNAKAKARSGEAAEGASGSGGARGAFHGRASFSKVSARTRMQLLDSRMGTGRINDRDRDRSPKKSLPFVLRVPLPLPPPSRPAEDNENQEESTPLRLRWKLS